MYQPNFTRTRQIYRGPRNSEKTNLEIQQIAYDLACTDAKLNEIDTKRKEIFSIAEDGFDEDKTYTWADVSDPIELYIDQLDAVVDVTPDSFYEIITELYRSYEESKRLLAAIVRYSQEN
jgi:hypothetical protein